MFYREAGQYKTTYQADMSIFPILQDRIGLALIMVAALVLPLFAGEFMIASVMVPFLILALASIGLNILTGYTGLVSLGTGAFRCFRSDGLMSKCHSAFAHSAWKRTAGGWRVIRSWS